MRRSRQSDDGRRVFMITWCSAASRVPFGGSAALDTTSAPCPSSSYRRRDLNPSLADQSGCRACAGVLRRDWRSVHSRSQTNHGGTGCPARFPAAGTDRRRRFRGADPRAWRAAQDGLRRRRRGTRPVSRRVAATPRRAAYRHRVRVDMALLLLFTPSGLFRASLCEARPWRSASRARQCEWRLRALRRSLLRYTPQSSGIRRPAAAEAPRPRGVQAPR